MKPNISAVKPENCSGCSICLVVCPKQAIQLNENEEGFFYPVINTSKCVNCGLCYDKCPFEHTVNSDNSLFPETWACWHKDDKVVKASSSGGIFTALAELIIEKGGTVYGASFDSLFKVQHMRVTSKDQLAALRGSKYIQSHMDSIYQGLYEDIKAGREVLFSGTPCQIAGVYRFFGEVPIKLYTCDLICHGISSSSVFRAYMCYIARKFEKPIRNVDFRSKDDGLWESPYLKFVFEETFHSIPLYKDPFFYGFLKNYFLRLSCYNCHYARIPRIADITIGDFWCRKKKNRPSYFNLKGTSLVLINNDKGKKFFAEAMCKLEAAPADFQKAVLYNPNIIKHTDYPKDFLKRKIIFDLIEKEEFSVLFENFLMPRFSFLEKLKYFAENPDKLIIKLLKVF